MPAVQMYSNFAEVAIAAYGVNLTATDDLLREYREKSGSRKIGVRSCKATYYLVNLQISKNGVRSFIITSR